MSNTSEYPVDPMAAFYAAVTAVENGSVAEVELEFRNEITDEHHRHELIFTLSVRRELRPYAMLTTNQSKEE